jgi:8-oxo-dGTP pyrophosphatase MutT (NUDIX family)
MHTEAPGSGRRLGAGADDGVASGAWRVVGETVYPKGDNPLGNPFYGYRTTDLVLPDGRSARYHGILVGDVVFAVPMEEDLTTHLIRQPRPNARAPLAADVPAYLELPGGSVHPGLGLAASVDREMCQEIGLRARTIEQIGVLMTSVGVSEERDTIFLATDLYSAGDDDHDEPTEQSIELVSEPFGRLYDQVRTGAVPVSAQTLASLTLVAARL